MEAMARIQREVAGNVMVALFKTGRTLVREGLLESLPLVRDASPQSPPPRRQDRLEGGGDDGDGGGPFSGTPPASSPSRSRRVVSSASYAGPCRVYLFSDLVMLCRPSSGVVGRRMAKTSDSAAADSHGNSTRASKERRRREAARYSGAAGRGGGDDDDDDDGTRRPWTMQQCFSLQNCSASVEEREPSIFIVKSSRLIRMKAESARAAEDWVESISKTAKIFGNVSSAS